MKLQIDLESAQDVIDAHELLGLWLNRHSETIPAPGKSEDPPRPAEDPAAVFGGQPQQDAAAVFGGAAAPSPFTPAPSTAGASLPSTAPGAVPGISTATPPAGQMPAPTPGASVPPAAAQTQALAPSVETDAAGLPWDARIHAGTKTKNKDQTWKKKPGVDPTTVTQVEAQLRGLQGNAAAPSAAPPAQSSAAPAMPAASTASLSDPQTFEQLMGRTAPAIAAGTIPPNAVQLACLAESVPNVLALHTNAALVAPVWAQLRAAYPGLQ